MICSISALDSSFCLVGVVEIEHGKRVSNKKEVKEMLSKYNLTEKQLVRWYRQGINKVLLNDWLSVYSSRCSPEKLGNVKIKTEW
ncbi:TipC family immunity protein [Enterococcus rotai]|uniref:TipC family immunity protein n=1 Tax=Enterococcus rotai TaxID=118060 RepID=UPI0035C74D8A